MVLFFPDMSYEDSTPASPDYTLYIFDICILQTCWTFNYVGYEMNTFGYEVQEAFHEYIYLEKTSFMPCHYQGSITVE
jgi:hypothetical protein